MKHNDKSQFNNAFVYHTFTYDPPKHVFKVLLCYSSMDTSNFQFQIRILKSFQSQE